MLGIYGGGQWVLYALGLLHGLRIVVHNVGRDTLVAQPGDGTEVCSGGKEGDLRVWELRTREMVSHLKEHTMRVTSIALFDDDVHALTCSRDRSFLCWDLRREKRISNHTQRMGGINSIVLSRDQTQVITAGQERKLTY